MPVNHNPKLHYARRKGIRQTHSYRNPSLLAFLRDFLGSPYDLSQVSFVWLHGAHPQRALEMLFDLMRAPRALGGRQTIPKRAFF